MDPFRHLAHEEGHPETGEEPHSNSRITCVWHKDDFYGTAAAKKSVGAGMFLLFVGYTAFVALRQLKKD
jgi:hypothetical protein